MAEGRSNAAIAEALVVSEGAVEKHTQRIFAKLGLLPDDGQHRRVLAVVRNSRWWLRSPVRSTNISRVSNHHCAVDAVERVVVVPGDDRLERQLVGLLEHRVVRPRGAVPASSSTSTATLVVTWRGGVPSS